MAWVAQKLGHPLMRWQREMADVSGEIDPETGWLYYRTVVLTVMRQQGKGLELSTPLPTPDGWTTMGDVVVGDRLFDESGKACTVTFATPPRLLDCYRLTFSDGTEMVADGDHLWTVGVRSGRWSTISTREMFGNEREPAGEARWRLPDVAPLECPPVVLPVAPYLLGVWLGDGTSTAAEVTAGDAEVDEMVALIEETGALVKSRRQDPRSSAWTLRVVLPGPRSDGLGPRLRALGVWGAKHIPVAYLRASRAQRVDLLRGLMDTDGTVSSTGTNGLSRQCEFTSCSERLAGDALELVRSLGIRATCVSDSATLNGEHVGWRWRVRFTPSIPVFRMGRKADRQAESGALRRRRRTIQSIERVEPTPTRCIKVDSPSALFLAGRSFVPTHNTTLTLPVWVERAMSWPSIHVAWTMQTGVDARVKWVEEHVPTLEQSPLSELLVPGSDGVRRQSGSEHVKFRNGSIQTLLASKRTSGHGQVVDLGMIDEAMAQPDDRLHQALRPGMKTRYRPGLPGAQLWIISTVGPKGESDWFHSWVDAGRAAVDEGRCERDRICFVEYSAPEDADPGDPAVWWACMPALGVTIEEETVAAEYREALLAPNGLAGFRRQALNQRTSQAADPPIPLGLWDRCVAIVDRFEGAGMVWAVDVSPEQASASIAVSWVRPDGVPQVQVVEHRRGVGWLPDRVSELRAKWSGVWLLDPRGASGSQAQGWPGLTVKPADARQACVELEAAAREGAMGHYGQLELRDALEGAVKRPSEDGGWSWARRSTLVDISPLVAAGLALWGVRAGLSVAGDPLAALW